MTGTRDAGRLRLTVAGSDASAFSLGPDDVPFPGHDGSGPSASVRSLAPTAEDRATGRRRFETTIDGWLFTVLVEDEHRALLRERAGQATRAALRHGPVVVRAQMPGRVVRLWVAEGDTVEAGQRLLAIEAMKMENEVRAPRAGTIESMGVGANSSVELGDELLTVR